jgi:hypothetical protein
MLEELQETDIREEGIAALAPQGGNAMTSIENATPPGMPVANIIEQQELARNASEAQLIEYARSPRPDVIPPYLVTSELMRRKTVREKAAKAPQFTVAQEAVQQAEQGIMNQMQLQAPKMPPGGAVPGREQITREQIMEKGIAPLPNPGQPSMTGFAEGGIIGFAAGGNRGLYFPNQRLTSNIQTIKPRSAGRPTGEPNYQLISMSGEPLISPYGDGSRDINETTTEKINIAGKNRRPIMTDDPVKIERASLAETLKAINEGDTTYESIVKAKNIEDKIAALDVPQDGYEYTEEEDFILRNPITNSEAGIKPLQPSQPGPQLPDFSGLAGEIKGDGSIFPPYTRLDAGEEAAGALGYFKEQLGEDPNRAAQVARLAEIEAKGLERAERDRKMNIASSFLKAAEPFFKPGVYGAQIGSSLLAGGQEYITGANAISDREEKLDDKLFALNTAMGQADRAEKLAEAKFGANSYQAAQAYNRKLEIQERADTLESQKIKAQQENTLAYAKFQNQITNTNNENRVKVAKTAKEVKKDVYENPGDYQLNQLDVFYSQQQIKEGMSEEDKNKIQTAKQRVQEAISREIMNDPEIKALQQTLPGSSTTQSNVVDFSSLK